jgi:hypothetical protein
MPRIRSLRPNVSREEATEQFTAGLPGALHATLRGPIRSVADFYIPFVLFQVTINNAGAQDTCIFGVDSVSGLLDPYQFEKIPDASQLISVDTRNCPQPLLDSDRARELLANKVRRLLFQKGFFRMRDLKIDLSPLAADLCVPYWVAFRGRGGRAYISVLDAVRRKSEGAKVRQLLENWLTRPI